MIVSFGLEFRLQAVFLLSIIRLKAELQTYSLLPTVFRSIVPAIRTTIARGVRRSASIIIKFAQPEMTEPLPRASPRSAVSTTASGVWATRAGGL